MSLALGWSCNIETSSGPCSGRAVLCPYASARPPKIFLARSCTIKPSFLDAAGQRHYYYRSTLDMATHRVFAFVQTMTDHMLMASYDPEHGWSDPEIKPYGPISLDPASSCFQYSTNVFEGMKVCILALPAHWPDSVPPPRRMSARMAKSDCSGPI